MKKAVTKSSFITIGILLTLIVAAIGFWPENTRHSPEPVLNELQKEKEESYKKIERKIARSEYFFRILRDPKTNSIPPNIRARELNFAKRLPTRNQNPLQIKAKDGTTVALEYTWESAGPTDVGGRTRALGIDQRNPNIIIAGGTSGGMWKSTDGGVSWQLKSDPTQNLSVTSLAQDPTEPDTWYYTSGEFRGQSPADNGNRAFYYGTGIFKSIDNGETWDKIANTNDTDTEFNSPYDFITRIVVSPESGSIFFASNGIGIYRVKDGGSFPQDTGPTPEPNLGTLAGHVYCDVAVAPDGNLIAALSQNEADGDPNSEVPGANPGIFLSTDDGDNWTEITPPSFPDVHQRSVVAFAPSAPDTAYVLTYVSGDDNNEDVRLHFLDLNDGGTVMSEDRSANIPVFDCEECKVGFMDTQSNYNMEVAVKSDDPDFLLIGGTNLFRSRDGFKTMPSGGYDNSNSAQKDEYWIGGYSKDNDFSQYPGQHPDQHVVVFDPVSPNVAWAGHDGGLSRTSDITASSVSWSDRNNGYITTQFYAAAVSREIDDNRLMGGTQDNGTPFFRFDSQQGTSTSASDIFGGDGGYAFFTSRYFYLSRQNGSVLRREQTSDGDAGSFAFVHPSGASNQIFIHPYTVDPNDEGIMYYPEGDSLWRNTRVDEISLNNNPDGVGASEGWESFEATDATTGFTISALEVSNVPSDILYYGASSNDEKPKIFKLSNASSSNSFQKFSISGAEAGSYVHDIAINPADANEVLVVFSNYNVPSIFQTTNGGGVWHDVEGNLNDLSSDAEPSVRSAVIVPAKDGTVYMVGTSTGIYSTTELNGMNTTWVREAPGSIGYAVTSQLALRISDGTLAAGTHGRGIFKGSFQGEVGKLPFLTINPGEARAGEEITITANNFLFNTNAAQNEVTFNGVPATVTNASQSQLTVVVPRGSIPPDSESNIVQIRISVNGTTASGTMELLPPNDFVVSQNFPNPFNPSTRIPFDLPERSGVIIQIFDMSGRKVLEPVRRVLEARTYNLQVDLSGLASGVYFYRVVAIPRAGNNDPYIETKKMTLIK